MESKIKRFTTSCVLSGLLLVSACVSYQATYDYDPEFSFAGLKTYDWIEDPAVSAQSELIEKHIRKAVDNKLTEMGYSRATESPDFKIAMHLGRENKTELTPLGYSYGSWYGAVNVYQYEEGTFVLDFVDTNTNSLVYRGVVRAELKHNVTPDERQQRIKKAVDKVLKYFPPDQQ